MPERSDRIEAAYEAAGEYELPYISKSRVMMWLKNPEHFRLKYLEGIEPGETDAMVRGTRIHETFEHYYDTTVETGGPLERQEAGLPADRQLWADFLEPYVTNFLRWESERAAAVDEPTAYLPLAVEEERWVDPVLGCDGEPEWMGLADVILPAAALPAVPKSSGVVIVDFKTGSVPAEQYRDEGIFTELAYYAILFEDKYDVAATAAYYPREDELLWQDSESPEFSNAAERVFETVREMVAACRDYEGDTKFEAKEGPLCKWGLSDDEESDFYGVCSKCTWGVPAKNENTFRAMVEEGYTDAGIADALGTSIDAVNYWKYKMDLK
jgi:hypothetical protein